MRSTKIITYDKYMRCVELNFTDLTSIHIMFPRMIQLGFCIELPFIHTKDFSWSIHFMIIFFNIGITHIVKGKEII